MASVELVTTVAVSETLTVATVTADQFAVVDNHFDSLCCLDLQVTVPRLHSQLPFLSGTYLDH